MKRTEIILKTKLSATLVIILGLQSCFSQSSADSLKKNHFEFVGGCDHHTVQRIFLDDSTFIDSSTIEYDERILTSIDTFMKGKDQWYYMNNGEWLPYFSKEKFYSKRKVCVFGEEKMVPSMIATPLREETINDRQLFVYRIQSLNDVNAFVTEYYFDFDLGVVKITDTGLEPECRTKVSSLLNKP